MQSRNLSNMNYHIKRIEPAYMPFTTIAYWRFEPNGDLTILVMKMSDWRFEAGAIIHEIPEALWCLAHGITTEQCDEWDTYYEKMYSLGVKSKKVAPGEDRRCPYYWGHFWGNVLSWIFDHIVGTDINKYRQEADRLMGIGD
jgi:hypothetical protein